MQYILLKVAFFKSCYMHDYLKVFLKDALIKSFKVIISRIIFLSAAKS